MLDDYWLTEPVNTRAVETFCLMVEIGLADKFDLTRDRMEHPHTRTLWDSVIQSKQDARYRTSLQAAVWRAGYFKQYLKPGRTVWEFETKGYREAINDGATILGTTRGVVTYVNATVNGEAQGWLKEERA